MTKMKASNYIAEFLRVQKTKHVFEVAGGMITHMLDSLYHLGDMEIISVHHEQTASFAVDAYGRCTGRPSVAFATSGPGATNLLTGIGSCYFDSSPALFITGQVNVHEQKGSRLVRQLGFQETDIVSMAKPITKKCYQVEKPEQLESILQEAYALTMQGRPGPVLIDIPMNIQSAQIEVGPINYIENESVDLFTDFAKLDSIYDAIQNAKQPLILVGQGVACARAQKEFLQFIELLQIPVVTSLLAVDAIPFEHPLRVGMIGSYGNRWANLTIGAADLLIVIGSRLDIRQTGAHIDGFRKDKVIYHIDCDESEINNRVKDCIPVIADAKDFLRKAVAHFTPKTFNQPAAWINEINSLRKKWPDTQELKDFSGINPNQLMHEIAQAAKECGAYLADVGNHQMWAAQSLEVHDHQLFLTSGGMGAMGFSLPAAIGCCFALGRKPVVVIVGDGSFQMNIQEIQTIVRNKLPIKMVIINNQALGMIRQFQDSYFDGRYQSTYWGYSAPNFAAIAEAYGVTAKTISTPEEMNAGASWLCEDMNAPALLQVMVNPHMNAYPKIAFGKPITEMEPFATPVEMEGT